MKYIITNHQKPIMGIKYFYQWFKSNFSSAIRASLPPVEALFIDGNELVYDVVSKVYRYGSFEKKLGDPWPIPTRTEFEDELIQEIQKIVTIVNPSKHLFITLDGVSPKAKNHTQRQRRLGAAKNSCPRFDVYSILPGTEFMKNVTKCLKSLESNDIEIHVSGDDEPGEGEHKLFKFPETKCSSCCFFGSDSDLILSCLLHDNGNFWIMRRNEFIDISKCRSMMRVANAETWIILCCVLGNDFLPALHGFGPDPESLNQLMDACENQSLVENGKICFSRLGQVFQKFYSIHPEFDSIKNLSYECIKFLPNHSRIVVDDYLATLQWIINYYSTNEPNWLWFYPHDDAPNLVDLCHLDDVEYEFRDCPPPSEIEQAINILPLEAIHLIPPIHRPIFESLSFQISVQSKSAIYSDWDKDVRIDHVNIMLN